MLLDFESAEETALTQMLEDMNFQMYRPLGLLQTHEPRTLEGFGAKINQTERG